jgi:hypothetical protein
MKASMGTARYKQLKKLTKEFVADALAPDAYVDHVASLFDSGYADHDLWSFLPSLLASLPNESSAQEAKRYMEQLRQNGTGSMTSHSNASNSAGGWSTKPSVAAVGGPSHSVELEAPRHRLWLKNPNKRNRLAPRMDRKRARRRKMMSFVLWRLEANRQMLHGVLHGYL